MRKKFTFRTFKKKDRVSAQELNDIVAAIKAAAEISGGASIDVVETAGGTALRLSEKPRFAIFELTAAVQMPVKTRTTGSDTEADVPWTEGAKAVWLDDGTYDMGTYDAFAEWTETIYFPCVELSANDIGIGSPNVGSGDRIFAFFNAQSGRWESDVRGEELIPATLTGNLNSGSSAAATLLIGSARATSGASVTVYDLPAFVTAGYKLASGVKIRIKWDGLAQKWVLITTSRCEVTQ